MVTLALPGSAYLYQGEELGLPEVATLRATERQDPTFFRSGGADVGRDGCRVPLPWEPTGPSFGFGAAEAHLPQPAWFGRFAVATQQDSPDSALSLYREALGWRRRLIAQIADDADSLTWIEAPPGVLHFRRPGGWHCVTNFSAEPVALPPGELLIASSPTTGPCLPAATTAWLLTP
jgi:alpha-glucosidase